MNLTWRWYDHAKDFEKVGRFLIENYMPGSNLRLWLQPRWEYMHYHPLTWNLDVSKIGIAEIDQQMIGVVNFESDEGIIYFQISPKYEFLKPQFFDFAEEHFSSIDETTGRMRRVIYINEADKALQDLAAKRGYVKDANEYECYSSFNLNHDIPKISLPEGFKVQSLAAENDLRKVNQVLWRGFNHPGKAPDEELSGRVFMQSAPNFRHDLTFVVVAPNGDYASFCGVWFVPENKLTYVEPVATDPDYRRMGLGKAAVLEGLRKTQELGAEIAWVISDQPFYLSMGFVKSFREEQWVIDVSEKALDRIGD